MPKPCKFSPDQDKIIIDKGVTVDQRRILAERFECNIRDIARRRRDLFKMDDRRSYKEVRHIRAITARPSFFEEEDLDSLMRGKR